jgi:hypothetical protein
MFNSKTNNVFYWVKLISNFIFKKFNNTPC